MKPDFDDLQPVEKLSLAYAPLPLKPALGLLLSLDSRLARVTLQASEPMIAQLKLVWWQDAIAAPNEKRPKGEPLLALLSDIEKADASLEAGHAVNGVVQAWLLLAAHDDWTPELRREFAGIRSAAIFGSFSRWVGSDDAVTSLAVKTGAEWALADLTARLGEISPVGSPRHRLARALRPLSILSFAAARGLDVGKAAGFRFIWHALTGR